MVSDLPSNASVLAHFPVVLVSTVAVPPQFEALFV